MMKQLKEEVFLKLEKSTSNRYAGKVLDTLEFGLSDKLRCAAESSKIRGFLTKWCI